MYIHYARQLYIIQSRILDQYIYVRFLSVVTVHYNSTDYYITNIVNRYYRQIDLCVQFSWADCTLYNCTLYIVQSKQIESILVGLGTIISSQRNIHPQPIVLKYLRISIQLSPRILYHSTIQRISDIDIISIDTHWIVLCTIGDISEIYTYIQSGLVYTGALI